MSLSIQSILAYKLKHSVLNTSLHRVSDRFRFHGSAVGAEHLLIILSEKTLFTALAGLTSFKKESMSFSFTFRPIKFSSRYEYLWCDPQHLFLEFWTTRDIIRSSLPPKPLASAGYRASSVGSCIKDTDLDGFHSGDS